MAGPTPTEPQSFLQILAACDNFRLSAASSSGERLVPWYLSPDPASPILGLLRPPVIDQLLADREPSVVPPRFHFDYLEDGTTVSRVSFAPGIASPAARTRAVREICEGWRDRGVFADVCGARKWRGELYPVFRRPFGVHDAPPDGEDIDEVEEDVGGCRRNYAFKMERAASSLFGIVTYGVHMTMYEQVGADSCRIWVPTRARTKQTWPGHLDNTVAGGIASGYSVLDTIAKEAMEEASLQDHIIRKHARSVGCVSYFYRAAPGWLQPEVEYVYELLIPPNADKELFTPKPLDGEVDSFEFLPLPEVIDRMRAGLFKPNCALVLLDFMIRHGYITPDDEPDYMELVTRLHGRFEYEKWNSI